MQETVGTACSQGGPRSRWGDKEEALQGSQNSSMSVIGPGIGRSILGPEWAASRKACRTVNLREAVGRWWADLGHRGWSRSTHGLAACWPLEEQYVSLPCGLSTVPLTSIPPCDLGRTMMTGKWTLAPQWGCREPLRWPPSGGRGWPPGSGSQLTGC